MPDAAITREGSGLEQVQTWFDSHGWQTFAFQQEVWRHYLAGKSGMIHSATGSGKTLAAWVGPLIRWMDANPDRVRGSVGKRSEAPPLTVLWITPLRALAADTLYSLIQPLEGLGIPWTAEMRTGDSTSADRAKQKKQLPTVLVTTPESLSLMLTHAEDGVFDHLDCVVVDEWHELMSSKRGVQTELALAKLRTFRPNLQTWGVSATLGNLTEAMQTLLGTGQEGVLVTGETKKEIVIDTLFPESIHRFPWAGHIGLRMLPQVIEAIEEAESSLIFTNTRATAELWHQRILDARPDWKDVLGLHHGSLSREVRDAVEAGLKDGRLKSVVCTSSLDLGVDFSPVDRVLQIGSPKGVARLLQRAGRSGHRPGAPSRVTCVPTHALEFADIAAARFGAEQMRIESREGVRKPLDLLAQHLVTCAFGDGFEPEAMRREVMTTQSFRDLADDEWQWALDFIRMGGQSLKAYDGFKRVAVENGRYRVVDKEIAQRHRMSIGTIVSDSAMNVQIMGGGYLGTVEESFISRLKPGDKFLFGGKPLQFVRVKDMTALVKRAKSLAGAIPRWNGGRMPLSGELSQAIREKLEDAKFGVLESEEMRFLAPLLETQAKWSHIPAGDEFLVERIVDEEGHHLFFFPFEGRLVHEGLSALFAYRITRMMPITFTTACNDYGFELLSDREIPLREAIDSGLFSGENLAADIQASLNSNEMAKRQFREVARVTGLVFQGFPGVGKSTKQLQASSGLFYDVFTRFDPDNMLLRQAHVEVLERQLEQSRLGTALERILNSKLILTDPPKPTPIAFPILVDRLRETISSESMSDQIERLSLELERQATHG